MKKEYIPFVEELIELAIREDIGDGDHTSLATIPADARGKMQLLVKQDGIIAGIEVARMVFDRLDGSVAFDQRIEDGACVRRGDIAFYVEGRILSLLQAERIVLNIMQRMSGVATQTAAYVKLLEGTHCRVLDTRKTTPGMRVLDKMAVKLGGGENHRMGLFDMILLKDNHIDFAGGIANALGAVRGYLADTGRQLPIEVEVRSLEDIDEVFAAGGGRPHHVRQLHGGDDARRGASYRRSLRNGVFGGYPGGDDAGVCRMRCGLRLGGCADAPDTEPRHEPESVRIVRGVAEYAVVSGRSGAARRAERAVSADGILEFKLINRLS